MVGVEYPSQRLARPFFMTAVVLFSIQIGYGLVIALQQVDPYFLRDFANFNINRAVHPNLAILWVLTGLIGAALFVGPSLAKRDLGPTWLVRFLLVALWAIAAWAMVSLPLGQPGIAGWLWGQPWLQQGLEFLELGRIGGILVLVGLGIVAYLVLRISPPLREWNELHWGLAIGVVVIAAMWVFGLFFVKELDLQEYFRWFVVHYWVEGAFEIVYTTVVGFLLWKLFDAELRVVGVAVFWGVLLVVLAGLIGNGHHYFWIGTPAIWQFWGSVFSALEPLPIFLVMWHVALAPGRRSAQPPNAAATYFIFGSALLYLVGAGVLGFTQTFAATNVWEHGTWVTPAHAHLAMFGTFGMLVLGAAYAIVPTVKGIRRCDDRLSKSAFWVMLSGILGMTTIGFALGGTVQVFVYRVLGLDWFRFEVRPALQPFRVLLLTFGIVFAAGLVLLVYDFFTLHEAEGEVVAPVRRWWRAPMTTAELAGWLLGIILIGTMLTVALLSNNLGIVRMGDPTLPFILAGIGYPSLAAITLAFAVRFLRALPRRVVAASDPVRGAGHGA